MKKLKYDYSIPEDPFVVDGRPETICRKIKEYFNEIGLSQNDIAKSLDVSQSAVSNQLNDRPFGAHSAKTWSKIFGFNINWLMTGEGPMMDMRKPLLTLVADNNILSNNCNNIISGELSVIPARMFKASNVDIYTISKNENIEKLPRVPHFPDHDLFAKCPGNAMYPKILPGSLLALKKIESDKLLDGKIYVINTYSHGSIIRKIFDNRDGTLKCVPINQDQFNDTIIFKFDLINVFEIVGCLNVF